MKKQNDEIKADWFYQCPKCKEDMKVVRMDVPVHFMEIVTGLLGVIAGIIITKIMMGV